VWACSHCFVKHRLCGCGLLTHRLYHYCTCCMPDMSLCFGFTKTRICHVVAKPVSLWWSVITCGICFMLIAFSLCEGFMHFSEIELLLVSCISATLKSPLLQKIFWPCNSVLLVFWPKLVYVCYIICSLPIVITNLILSFGSSCLGGGGGGG
jgi:hypothetical protein